MAKNDARKSFVAARLKETGKEATPEQRAKFRERFNQLSQTKEGRTKIAQKVLPGGTAAERKALKSSIRPPQTSTSTTSTTGTTSNKTDYPGFVNKGYRPEILNNVNLPSNNSSSSAPIPSTTTTVPRTTTSTTVPRTTTSTTSSNPGKSGFRKTLDWLGKGMPGTDEWKAKPGLSAADLPLGAGQIYTGIQETKKGNYVGGIARTFAGVGELAINILSAKGGRSEQLQIGPGEELGPIRYGSQTETPLQLNPGPKTTVTQVSPSRSVAQENAAARMAALENEPAVPVNPPRSKSGKPKTTTPVTTPVTTPAASNRPPTALENKLSDLVSDKKTSVTTPAAPVSPPVTTPMNYLTTGTRVGEFKQWRPGDPKPTKPRYSKSTDSTDLQIDYEIRLHEYNKYNPKKK